METEARLFDCALTVFAEKGYDRASIRDIIAAAGVTQPTLYYYCKNKLELFRRIIEVRGEAALETLRVKLTEQPDSESQLRLLAVYTFELCVADLRAPQLMFQSFFGPRIPEVSDLVDPFSVARRSLIRDVLQKSQDASLIPASDLVQLESLFCSLIDHHVCVALRKPHPEQQLTPEIAHRIVDFFLAGARSLNRFEH